MSLIARKDIPLTETRLPVADGYLQDVQVQDVAAVAYDCEALTQVNESILALEGGEATQFDPSILKNLVVRLRGLIVEAQRGRLPAVGEARQIEEAIIDYVVIAKKMIESEGSKWKAQYETLKAILNELCALKPRYVFPQRGLVSRAVGLFFSASDPWENFFLRFQSFQETLRNTTIHPKDDPKAKAALQRQNRIEQGMSERTKRVLNFACHAMMLFGPIKGPVETLQMHSNELRSELVRSMGVQPAEPLVGRCIPVETMEKDLKEAMESARPEIVPDEETLKQYGNKHKNLVQMAHLNEALGLSELEIPLPRGISTDQVHALLDRETFLIWQNLKEHKDAYTGAAPFLDDPRTVGLLRMLDQTIVEAFAKPEAYEALFSPEMRKWIEAQAKSGNYLMVRSTGSEDSHQMANAGGNESKAYVPPTPAALCEAVSVVVRSYFSKNSLQNRLNGKQNPFDEELKLAVTVQELIGEPVGGAQNPEDVPVSFVLFTNEPLIIGDEEIRATRITATRGHGNAVVSGQGVAVDTALIFRSKSHPDQLYSLYNNQKKLTRLAPLRKENGEVELGPVENPASLRDSPSLNPLNLIDIYRNGVLMESFFSDHPTDIEGVVKNGKVYFVQARPINRKRFLPTYLDLKDKNPVVEKHDAEVLVAGAASVLSITARDEVLFTTPSTLEEAQSRLAANPKTKLVIVTQPEPENSHPVVNFSGLGMPCLYISDGAAVEALLAKIDKDHPLAVCMQKGTLNLWDNKIAQLEDHIVEGFAVHPAKIAISLDVPSGLGAIVKPPAPRDLEEALKQNDLDKIEAHPQLKYLRAKRRSLQDAFRGKPIPAAIQERLQVLIQLDRNIKRATQEMRSALADGGRLEQLFHAKVLRVLFLGSPSDGLGRYSLLDVKAICDDIGTLSKYQDQIPHASHALDLLLDGKAANPEAFSQWEQFLLQLEPLVQEGKISPENWERFRQLVVTLRETGALPFWLTFFQKQAKSPSFRPTESMQLDRFENLIDQVPPEDNQLMAALVAEQQTLHQMRLQVERFADPKTFPSAWKELQSRIATYSSDAWLAPLKTASPIAKSIAYRTMETAVDLIDASAKTLKSSRQFPNNDNVRLFKEIVQSFFEMSRAWAEKLIPEGKIGTHAAWPLTRYFGRIQELLRGMPIDNPVQFLPTRGFSVAAAMLGARTAFERHEPSRLEEMLMLDHQNSLFSVNQLNQELLSASQIQESLLPHAVKQAMDLVERSGWRGEVQRIGMSTNSKEVVLKYNVPLRNHSGHLDLHYDVLTGKMVLKAHFLGQARTRWGDIEYWIRALEIAGEIVQDRPLSMNDQEIRFSLVVTPENLAAILKVYSEMAAFTLDEDNFAPGLIAVYDRNRQQPEVQQKLKNYCLENLNRRIVTFYRHYASENEGQFREVIDVIAKAAHSDDADVVRESHGVWEGLLLLDADRFRGALQEAVKKGVSSSDANSRRRFYHLLSVVQQPQVSPFDMEIYVGGMLDEDVDVRALCLREWKSVFSVMTSAERAHIVAKSQETLRKGLAANHPGIKEVAYELLRELSGELDAVKDYQLYIDAAATGLLGGSETVRRASLATWSNLLRGNHGVATAQETANKGSQSSDPHLRAIAHILKIYICQSHLSDPSAVDVAVKGILYEDDGHQIGSGVQQASLPLWTALLWVDEGVEAARRAIVKGLGSNRTTLREAALDLLTIFVDTNNEIEDQIASDAVRNFVKDGYFWGKAHKLTRMLIDRDKAIEAGLELAELGIKDLIFPDETFELLKSLAKKKQGHELVVGFLRSGRLDARRYCELAAELLDSGCATIDEEVLVKVKEALGQSLDLGAPLGALLALMRRGIGYDLAAQLLADRVSSFMMSSNLGQLRFVTMAQKLVEQGRSYRDAIRFLERLFERGVPDALESHVLALVDALFDKGQGYTEIALASFQCDKEFRITSFQCDIGLRNKIIGKVLAADGSLTGIEMGLLQMVLRPPVELVLNHPRKALIGWVLFLLLIKLRNSFADRPLIM
ncbi:MAG TPA: PEP/pyruvate-binding domain-containing protein [Chlamydiales bacterium]|nr:PEP/pyruvate-binding domain-containing protein [Chlamydiales bacterium]